MFLQLRSLVSNIKRNDQTICSALILVSSILSSACSDSSTDLTQESSDPNSLLPSEIFTSETALTNAYEHEVKTYRGASSSRLGESVDTLGDINGDGFSEYIIGAPEIGTGTGYVSVQNGVDGSRIFKVSGDNVGDAFGVSVSQLADVDNDGVMDILVGAIYGGPFGNGYVKVLSGIDGSEVHNLSVGSDQIAEFGWRVLGLDDINNDGYGEIVVGTIKDSSSGTIEAGHVRIYSGLDAELMHSYIGNGPYRHLGQSLAQVGDIDGDNTPDLAMGSPIGNAPAYDYAGLVQIVSGLDGSIINTFYGPEQGTSPNDASRFGRSISTAGDLNGDLVPDLVVGAITDATGGANAGKVYVLSGADGSEIFTVISDSAEEFFGESVSGGRDVNQDGVPDIVASGFNGGVVISGADRSILFRTPALLPELSTEGNNNSGGDSNEQPDVKSFGTVKLVEDLNKDGYDDILLGSPLDSANGVFSGKVTLFSGKPADNIEIVDSFESASFADGKDGNSAKYLHSCSIDDQNVGDGQLTISGPIAGCEENSSIISSREIGGELVFSTRVVLDGNPMTMGAGITLAAMSADGTELALLALLRTSVEGFTNDAIILSLGDELAVQAESLGEEPQISEVAIITDDTESYSVPHEIELKINLGREGDSLVAHGSYRELPAEVESQQLAAIPFISMNSAGGPDTVFPLGSSLRFSVIGANQSPGNEFNFSINEVRVTSLE